MKEILFWENQKAVIMNYNNSELLCDMEKDKWVSVKRQHNI